MKSKGEMFLACFWSATAVISFLNACMCLWLIIKFYEMGWLV